MHACMYVSMYVRVYVCMHACAYVYIYIYMHTFTYLFIHIPCVYVYNVHTPTRTNTSFKELNGQTPPESEAQEA